MMYPLMHSSNMCLPITSVTSTVLSTYPYKALAVSIPTVSCVDVEDNCSEGLYLGDRDDNCSEVLYLDDVEDKL